MTSFHVAVKDPKAGMQVLWTTGIADFVAANAVRRSKANPFLTFVTLEDTAPIGYWVNGEQVAEDATITPKVKTKDLQASLFDATTMQLSPIDGAPAFVEALDAFMLAFARQTALSDKLYKRVSLVAQAQAYAIDEAGSPVLDTYHYVDGKRVEQATADLAVVQVRERQNAHQHLFATIWGVDYARMPKGFPQLIRPLLQARVNDSNFDALQDDLDASLPYLEQALPSITNKRNKALVEGLIAVARTYSGDDAPAPIGAGTQVALE